MLAGIVFNLNLKTLYIWFAIKKDPLINIVRSLCVYEAITRIGTLKHLTNTVKIVKKKSFYEVASLKFLTLLNELVFIVFLQRILLKFK